MALRFLYFVLLLIAASTGYAQDYRKFKFGIGFGPNVSRYGSAAYIEPMWRLSNAWSLGFREEMAGGQDFLVTSATVNGQWYFADGRFRPFVGVGLGYYLLSTDALGVIGPWSFGAYPRAGFDLGHFNFTVDYNWIAKQLPESLTLLGVPYSPTPDRTASYLTVKIGVSLGGGRRMEGRVTK
jgi:hypothetical protein